MRRTIIIETVVFFYAILFLYTGISKLMEYSIFKEQLLESPVLAPIAPMVAVILPWLEFIIVTIMFIPRWRLKGLYAATLLMIIFTVYVIALLSFSNNLPCSCGGVIAQLSWPQHLIFNGAFIALAITGIILQRQKKKQNQSAYL